jgi:hypothetical protein
VLCYFVLFVFDLRPVPNVTGASGLSILPCSFDVLILLYFTLQALANGFDGLYYNRSQPLNIVLFFCVVILCVFMF